MDALDLIAKLKMDISEYEEGLSNAEKKASSSGSSISGAFGKVASGVGTAMATAAKVTTVAIGAAATGVATLTTKAIEGYSEYEQLVGGIETLFGAGGKSLEDYANSVGKTVSEASAEYNNLMDAQNTMLDNASNAYKTAGLSANDYMDTAISMSAAMINSLDGDTSAAANMVDMAITDMSDNVNKMGTSMESIQNAYVGFSRGNYTMLDNLALGFSGTKEGMQELLDKAEELSGVEYDISSYSDIVSAIHVVQTEMGITGTTAEEASTTIQGSLNQTKAAWSNLVTGLADDNANLEQLMQNLVDSIVGYTDEAGNEVNGFLDNIIPVIETALDSIGTLVEKLVPTFIGLFDNLLSGDLLTNLTESATSLVGGFVSAISDNMDTISNVFSVIVTAIADLIPDIITLGGQLISTLGTAIIDNLDTILDAASEILEYLLTGLSDNASTLVDAAVTILEKLVGFFTDNASLIMTAAVEIVTALTNSIMEHLGDLILMGMELVIALVEGLGKALPQLIEAIPTIIETFTTTMTEHTDDIASAFETLMMAITDAIPAILDALAEAMPAIIEVLVNYWTGDGAVQMLNAGYIMFTALVTALGQIAVSLVSAGIDALSNLVKVFTGGETTMLDAGKTMFTGLLDGFDEVASNIVSSIGETITGWVTTIRGKVSDFVSVGKSLMEGLWSGIKSAVSTVTSGVASVANTVVSSAKSAFQVNSPSKRFIEIGKSLTEGLEVGWEKNIDDVNKAINNSIDYEGNIDVSTNVENAGVVTASAVNTSMLSDADINKLAEAISVNVYANTYLDGKEIGESSYKYTVGKITDDERALSLATGGGY